MKPVMLKIFLVLSFAVKNILLHRFSWLKVVQYVSLLLWVLVAVLSTGTRLLFAHSELDEAVFLHMSLSDRNLRLTSSCDSMTPDSPCQGALVSESDNSMVVSKRCLQWLTEVNLLPNCEVHASSCSGKDYGKVSVLPVNSNPCKNSEDLPAGSAIEWGYAYLSEDFIRSSDHTQAPDVDNQQAENRLFFFSSSFFSSECSLAEPVSVSGCTEALCSFEKAPEAQSQQQTISEGTPMYKNGQLKCLAIDSGRCRNLKSDSDIAHSGYCSWQNNLKGEPYYLCGYCNGQRAPDYDYGNKKLPDCGGMACRTAPDQYYSGLDCVYLHSDALSTAYIVGMTGIVVSGLFAVLNCLWRISVYGHNFQ